jgi:beta-galactosidase
VHLVRRAGVREKSAIDPGYEPVSAALQEPLLPDWSPLNTAPHTESVEAYTNCEEAELFLNGRSLGRQKLHADATPLTWEVPYEPGSLQAVAYRQGQPVAKDELRTAGRAARIVLSPDRATLSPDGNDVATVVATVVDEAGVPVPDAAGVLQFTVSGPAQIVATDNGSSTDHDSFLLPRHHLYGGRAIAILRATASQCSISIHASAEGMAGADARLTAVPANSGGWVRSF